MAACRRTKVGVLVAVWMAAGGAAGAQVVPTTRAELGERTERIADFVAAFVDTSAVPGVSLALGVGDSLTWLQGFGYADVATRRPAEPSTRFRIGSVSKALTGVVLGLLVEDGALELDAPVQRYVPEFPDKGNPITLRQLATHQAGIRHYRGDEAYSDRHYDSVLEAISVFADDSLVAEPGTRFSYSTYGYTLLSAAMERAAGRPFLDLMRNRLLAPLELTHTVPEIAGEPVPGQATGYELGQAGEPVLPSDVDLPGGRRLLVAGGSAIGGTTVLFVFPDDDVFVVFLTNMGNAPIRGVPMTIARMLLGEGG
jgi:serine beta-lactamase-like protein LACTB